MAYGPGTPVGKEGAMKRVRKFWTGLVVIAALLIFQPGLASAISPGISTPTSAYPFMTRVYAAGVGWCGGTLIAPSWVLTAAHCVVLDSGTTVSPSAVKAAVGVEASHWAAHWQKIDRVVRHPNFPAHIRNGAGRPYDVALLHLTKPATQGKPIGLANFEPGVEWNLTELGWDGQGDLPEYPLGSLHYNNSVVRSDSDCHLPLLGAAYTASMFCARTSAGAPLLQNGDSGGPVLIIVLRRQLLAGVEDANNGYDLLGSVHYVQSWITHVSGVVPTIPTPPSTDRFGVFRYNQLPPMSVNLG